MKNCFSLLILFFSLVTLLNSQDRTTTYLEDPYKQPVDMIVDIIHMKLNLDIEPYTQIIKGTQNITFKTLRFDVDSLVFYASEMEFRSVTINGVSSDFSHRGNEAIVYNKANLKHNQIYEMIIEFTGNPTSGLYFSGWNDKTNRHRKQIWSHSPQGWMPFINQKPDLLTTEVILTFDSKYKVFSNGKRILQKDNKNGTTTWHYHMDKPHVVYLICLAVGDWEIKSTKSKSGVPLELYYYPDLPENVEPTYAHSEYMIDYFEKEIGIKYPYSVYRQAPMVNYMYGGMETTTATVFGDYMHIPPRAWWMRNYVNVNSHELNHQWFGNLVSHLNNRHTWLTESFATHYAKMFERDLYGEDYYQWERDKELIRALNASKSNNNPVAHSFAGTDRWYPKGSLVLDMMRDVLSDSLFRLSIKNYTQQHSFKVTETYDLQKSIRESTGMAMDWFFDQWIWRGGEPHFKVSYNLMSENGYMFTSTEIEQIHKVDNLIGFFRVPANIHVYYEDGSIDSAQAWIDGQKSFIRIPNKNNKNVDFVVFDPNRKILKKVTFNRNVNQLLAQAEKSKNMIDRYDALLELSSYPTEQKRLIYHKIFKNEKFHLTKSEIIKQLSNDEQSIELIKNAAADPDALVRRAVVQNIQKVPEEIKTDYEKMLFDSCFINSEYALRNLSNSFPEIDYLDQTKNERGWRGLNIRMAWLEIALMKDNNKRELINELVDYTSNSFEFETRINALSTLIKLNIINPQIVANAIDAYLHWNFKLRDGGFDYLKYFYRQASAKKMIDKEIESSNFNIKQLSSIHSLKVRIQN